MLLLEIFCLLEQLPHLDFSKALQGLPADNRSNSKIKRLQKVHRAFRQRSQVDHSEMAFFNPEWRSFLHQEAITYIQNIQRSFRSRHYLRKLLKVLVDCARSSRQRRRTPGAVSDCRLTYSGPLWSTANSLKKTMQWDCEQAAKMKISCNGEHELEISWRKWRKSDLQEKCGDESETDDAGN